MTLATESRLGPYQVQSLLGSGSMGEVYRARDTRLDREVAIKVISSRDAGPEARRRFLQEARAVSALNHPNIVTMHDVGEEDGISYIVTELIEGEPLRHIIKQSGPLPLKQLLDLGIQIADGLADAHQSGMVHRDLKPENIMVTPEGRVKILDFGLAKPVQDDISNLESTLGGNLTAPGLVIGTAAYMSPEQARGGRVSFWSDQFAFGAILYELTTGQSAFRRESGLATLSAILTEDPPVLTRGSAAFQWLVKRCLHKQPDHRYASTTDLLRELQNIRAHMTDTLAHSPANEESPNATAEVYNAADLVAPLSSKAIIKTFWLVGALALAGVLGFAASYFFVQRPRTASMATRFLPYAATAALEVFPAWSPNGKTMAFVADTEGLFQIFARSSGTAAPVQLTQAAEDCFSPFWSPDGARLYYISGEGEQLALWSVGATGGSPEKLLDNVAQAAIAPDGRTVAAIRKDSTTGNYALWIGSVADLQLGRYTHSPFDHRFFLRGSYLHFSPDGKNLGIWLSQGDGRTEFWLLPFPNGEPGRKLRALEHNPVPREFAWTSDSRRIIFADSSQLSINFHLFEADIAHNSIDPLTTGIGNEFSPSVSRDGKRIAYSSVSLDYDIVAVPLAGGPMRDLLATPLSEVSPAISRDGQYAFVTDRTGEPEIWLKNPRDGSERPLGTTSSFGEDRTNILLDIAFSPDGRRLAYRRAGTDDEAIWISPITGDPPVRLAKEPGDAFQRGPTWSPDGNSIAYFSLRDGRFVLMRARVGGLEPPVVIANSAGIWPLWSPGGDWIASLNPSGGVTLVTPSGTSRHDAGSGAWLLHGWSMDGRHLYGLKQTGNRHLIVVSLRLSSGEETTIGDLGPSLPAANYGAFIGALPFRGFALSSEGTSFVTSVLRPKSDIWVLERNP